MLTAANLVAFVATADADRAQGFYEEVLGLRLLERTSQALVFDARQTELRVTTVEGFTAAEHTVLGWQVAEARRAVRELVARGVVFERFDGLRQDDLGIWEAPGGALVAWFRDHDGNLLSITES